MGTWRRSSLFCCHVQFGQTLGLFQILEPVNDWGGGNVHEPVNDWGEGNIILAVRIFAATLLMLFLRFCRVGALCQDMSKVFCSQLMWNAVQLPACSCQFPKPCAMFWGRQQLASRRITALRAQVALSHLRCLLIPQKHAHHRHPRL